MNKSYKFNSKAISYFTNIKKMFDEEKTNVIYLMEINSVEMDIIIQYLSCYLRYGYFIQIASKITNSLHVSQRIYDCALLLGFDQFVTWYPTISRNCDYFEYKPNNK
ncbi:putative orfan [Tupanvirus soda lake]|uniref:Orfan n=2 Tax=Tupanvirus TaxID=2094720 RepID=A0AC62AAK0_9VIRU|nr:putative orfan [Tupanvirus soda lake]QKU34781.1 putative orfan [Tupanvirus soda lake]